MKAPLLPKEGSWVWSLMWVTACSGGGGASPQLIHARSAYERAQQTPTSHYALDALSDAKKSLHAAEVAHEREPSSYDELSLAYVASVHTGEGTTSIQLNSSVMFASGEASLLPYARATWIVLLGPSFKCRQAHGCVLRGTLTIRAAPKSIGFAAWALQARR